MISPHILVADADREFLSTIANDPNSQVKVTPTATAKETQLAIADHKQRYSAICIGLNLADPQSLPVVRFAKAHRPSTPLYLLAEESPSPFDANILKALHVQTLITKPIDSATLIKNIIPTSYFDLAAAAELAGKDETVAGEEKEVADESMHAIDANSFIGGRTSFFDLFVRISNKKYLMLVKAGDDFEPARLATYLRKGVTTFYVKKEAQLFYLQYCDRLTEALLASDKVSTQAKSKMVSNLGRETTEYLKSAGISEATLQNANRFVQHSHSLIKRSALGDQKLVKEFLSDLILAEHGTSTTIFVSMMVNALKFSDEKVINAIAMAAMLHDIGLMEATENLRREKMHKMTPAERETFELHPMKGHEILSKVPHINPLLPQVVLQHHERRNRQGFPYQLGAGAISPVAEIVGIADTFLGVLEDSQEIPGLDPIAEMRTSYLDGFSVATVDAFFKALHESKR